MKIPFVKMQGAGNDYAFINAFETDLGGVNLGDLAEKMSRRRFSVGADGIIIVEPSRVADVKMRIFNADGSEGKTCGNGLRCAGKLARDVGIVRGDSVSVETQSGIRTVKLLTDGKNSVFAAVDMGRAELEPSRIPVLAENNLACADIEGRKIKLFCVGMGNPHAVVAETYDDDFESFAEKIEKHPIFPERANVEFVRFVSANSLSVRVWERGSGETFACGSGACAAAVAAVRLGKCLFGEPVFVNMRGGTLTVTVRADLSATLVGAAVTAYIGEFEYAKEDLALEEDTRRTIGESENYFGGRGMEP